MSSDVEFSRQRMLEAQEAFLAHARRSECNPKSHAQLIQEFRKTRQDFLDSIERLGQNPHTRLVSD